MQDETDAGFKSGRISAKQAQELINKEVSRPRKSLRDAQMSVNNSGMKKGPGLIERMEAMKVRKIINTIENQINNDDNIYTNVGI